MEEVQACKAIATLQLYKQAIIVRRAPSGEVEEIDSQIAKIREALYEYKRIKMQWAAYMDKLKERQRDLTLRGLAEYFYQPDFIQEWLDAGFELEDYLK